MITEQQAGTLEYFYDELLGITAISVGAETRRDEAELAKFGLTRKMLSQKNLPSRSHSTAYFERKQDALVVSQKDFYKALQDGTTLSDFLNQQKGNLKHLRERFARIEHTSDYVRACCEGQESGMTSVIDLLEEMVKGKA